MDLAKKETILQAAAKAFAHFGFKKASIDDIASSAGVGKGTIYLAARSKKDLFFQALEREVRRWVEDNARVVDVDADAVDALRALLAAEVDSVARRPLVAELLIGHVARVLPAAFAERLADLRHLARANLLDALRRGAQAGRFRRDLDLEEVAVLLQDLQTSALVFHDDGPDRDGVLYHRWDTTMSALVDGLRPRSNDETAGDRAVA